MSIAATRIALNYWCLAKELRPFFVDTDIGIQVLFS